MATAAEVKAEFLKVWPLGTKCEHTHAREGFKLLDEMIEQEENPDQHTGLVGDPQ